MAEGGEGGSDSARRAGVGKGGREGEVGGGEVKAAERMREKMSDRERERQKARMR